MVDQLDESNKGKTKYILDTNVLIHDPNAILNFQEHEVAIPMVVLEELDKLKVGKQSASSECRQAIRLIDSILGDATPEELAAGVPIPRGKGPSLGKLSILIEKTIGETQSAFTDLNNDNKIIEQVARATKALGPQQNPNDPRRVVLVTKDINMRIKAKGLQLLAEDYSSDQLVDDVDLLPRGYHEIEHFWSLVDDDVYRGEETGSHKSPKLRHQVRLKEVFKNLHVNEYLIDENGFVGQVKSIDGVDLIVEEISMASLMSQEAWGLKPRDIYQAIAMHALLDDDTHLVNLVGAAGSGKTILALAAAIEQTMVSKKFNKIVVMRSIQNLDEEIGFLPGTEEEKMLPWLGAITDNLEALHKDDMSTSGSVEYILSKVPLQFKSLNYIRGRSFQNAFILIDESQNLTPHQMKTIITRAGDGSKVICLGNLAQIDTPYLSATSSGLTYLTERFKDFPHGATVCLQGVPRSVLAEYAESVL
ncbi:PhoH family protein [Pseudomonas aeruginosa]